jgi:hypothetical protein
MRKTVRNVQIFAMALLPFALLGQMPSAAARSIDSGAAVQIEPGSVSVNGAIRQAPAVEKLAALLPPKGTTQPIKHICQLNPGYKKCPHNKYPQRRHH